MLQQEPINWSALARAIERQRAVLFIGPGLSLNYAQAGRKTEREFLQEMAAESGGSMKYLPGEGFVIFRDRRARVMRMPDIEGFYGGDFGSALLDKLLQIPFHLIISLSPDLSIEKSFGKQNFDRHAHYYQKGKSKGTKHNLLEEKPSGQKPLIYQLLGSIKDPESLVLTHKDLFDYMQSLYGNQSLPTELLEAFAEERSDFVVFLGFDFHKWYYQFILHVLELQQTASAYATSEHELGPPYDDSHFRIQVLEEDIHSFVDNLHGQFGPERLRQSSGEANRPQRKYLDKPIFKLLNGALIQGELETFCMLNFEEVYDNFSPDQSRSARLTNLFDYVKTRGQFEELLELLREENPYQYEKNGPYYEEA